MDAEATLPPGITVFERGWLSSNNILLQGKQQSVLVDSGYCTHSEQTLMLLERRLGAQPLDALINTHLHSDHCGGNAALQQRYPRLNTQIPPGQTAHVVPWDAEALSYLPTGQQCPPFSFDAVITAGQELALADVLWQVHAAPGHDPHAVMLLEPRSRTLISGDALWERGFGVVFPELEGAYAFDEVSATLDVIEALKPRVVIPGHGKAFSGLAQSLSWARKRLEGFANNPTKHAHYAAKVLIKFKLLETQEMSMDSLLAWCQSTPYLGLVQQRYFTDLPLEQWIEILTLDLVRTGSATRDNGVVRNA
jgi:glyoxylase-like metal-dependent hydrolase (beta-lactamase superfamily II)